MADVSALDDETLEMLFNGAANVVQNYATAEPSASNSSKPTDSQLLELYGLYKVATTGPCKEPQPGNKLIESISMITFSLKEYLLI